MRPDMADELAFQLNQEDQAPTQFSDAEAVDDPPNGMVVVYGMVVYVTYQGKHYTLDATTIASLSKG
jgi:hypothetical protein